MRKKMMMPSTLLPLLLSVVVAQQQYAAQPSPSRGDPPPISIPVVPTSHHGTPTHSVFDMMQPPVPAPLVPAPIMPPTIATDDRQKKKGKKGNKVKHIYHHPHSVVDGGTPDDDLCLLFPHPITIFPSRKTGKGGVVYIPAPVPVSAPAGSPVIPPINIPPVALLPVTVPSAVAPPPVVIPPISIPYVEGMPSSPSAQGNDPTTAVPYPKGSTTAAKNSQYKKQAQIVDASSIPRHPGYDTGGTSSKRSSSKRKHNSKKSGGSSSSKQKHYDRSQDYVASTTSTTVGTFSSDPYVPPGGESGTENTGDDAAISGAYAMYNPPSTQQAPALNVSVVSHQLIPAPADDDETLPAAQQDQAVTAGGQPALANGDEVMEMLIDPVSVTNATNPPMLNEPVLTANGVPPPLYILDDPVPVPTNLPATAPNSDVDSAGASAPSPTSALLAPTTTAPTSFPVLGIEQTATRVVSSDPVYLRITGTFNPGQEKAIFFDVLEENFEPYGRAYVGADTLKDLDLQVEFFPDVEYAAQQRQKVTEELVASWAEILITFHVSLGHDIDSDQASQIVRRFFVASHKERFVGQLEDAGVDISNMLVFDDIPDEIKASRGEIIFNDDFFSDGPVPTFEGNDEISANTSNRSSAIVAAILSGGIILLALGCVILSNRRRQQQGFNPVEIGKDGEIEYDNMSSDSNSNRMGVFPSDDDEGDDDENDMVPGEETLDRDGEPYFQSVMSCNSSVSSYPSKIPYQSVADQSSSLTLQPTGTGLVEERALVLIDDTPDLMAAAALANEHPSDFQQQHANTTPDFLDDQDGAPPSPIWSLDNFSNANTSTTAGVHEDMRRRWHEASTDADSVGVPDHCSNQEQGAGKEKEIDHDSEEDSGRGIV